MRRFRVPRSSWGDVIELPREEAHHAHRVLRLREGDEALVFDGEGREVQVRIVELSSVAGVVVPMGSERRVEAGLTVVLGQGLPRGDKLEEVIQHGTELGLTELYPVLLERSVSRPDPARAASRLERWERIAQEAAKQCERLDVPTIQPVGELEAFCRRFEERGSDRLGLLCYEAAPFSSTLETLQRLRPALKEVWILVGPEGGLTDLEVVRAMRAGFQPIRLGPRILRTETAGLTAIALSQFLWGDLSNHRQTG